MEALVIPLPVKKKEPKVDLGPAFYCLRCDHALFQLLASGEVRCAGCGAAMRNITVFTKPDVA